jgi:hypothetical protein
LLNRLGGDSEKGGLRLEQCDHLINYKTSLADKFTLRQADRQGVVVSAQEKNAQFLLNALIELQQSAAGQRQGYQQLQARGARTQSIGMAEL